MPPQPAAAAVARPPRWTAQTRWALVAVVAIALSLIPTGLFQRQLVNPGGLPQLGQFFRASLQPDLSPAFLHLTVQASLTTLAYAVCGTVLSLGLGLIGGVLASEVWWLAVFPRQRGAIGRWLRVGLALPRAIHELIWGLFFVNIFGLDPLVGILGIAIPYGAIVAKVFSELLDETPRPPLNALVNSGVAPLPALMYSLLPQALLDLVSYSFYRFECSLRSAAVLGIIGAGGLGYEILLSLQSLRYPQLWTLFYALLVLNGSVDLGSALLRRRLGAPSRLDLQLRPTARRAAAAEPPPAAGRAGGLSIASLVGVALALLLIGFSFVYVGADFSKLWLPRTLTLLTGVAAAALPPDLNRESLATLAVLCGQTLAMSILAIALAGIGGILLSVPAAHSFFLPGGLLNRSGGQRRLAWFSLLLTRGLLLVCRAIPAPIWALVALFVLFPGILPGAIALGLHNLGILGRLMAEVNENLDPRPLLALSAQGARPPLVFLYGVLPMTLTRFLAYILYRWEVCMRETVIVGLVGAGGLGRLLTEQLSSFAYAGLVVSLGGFILLTLAVDWISGAARRALR